MFKNTIIYGKFPNLNEQIIKPVFKKDSRDDITENLQQFLDKDMQQLAF